ncbi:hypothetical protein BG011_005143 [Mortierella polycephala]|uniref:Peptidase S59 domain-containing protein n=1 Tax=Mortierella polycephala TaxID=41804 RepID=A0A9P6QC22_9FUNG|nr:hypothetical protein BG011_005143 [Mortierella polycephala]
MFTSAFNNGGGFGGQQQQQNTGFGSGQNTFGSAGSFGAPAAGFGAAANPGFGGAAQNTGFGAAAPTTSAFGAAPASTGFGGFGGSSTGFGVQAQTQPQAGFGGSAFGATNPSTSTGGFGAGGFGTTAATTGGFGSGAFGAKPATTGFGTQAPIGFGATANTGFGGGGGGMTAAGGNGTVNPPFAPVVEKDPATGQNSHYQSITAMQAYRGFSFEELRLQDYQQGRKFPGQGAGFGGTTAGFGQQQPQQQPAAGFGAQTSTGFGANTSSIGGFGAGAGGFGNTATSGFGATPGFGATAPTTTAFGGQTAAPTTGFGATTSAFGAQAAPAFGAAAGSTGFGNAGGFGASTAAKPATAFGGFGATASSQPATGFGATGGFGGSAAAAPTSNLFGNTGAGATGPFGAAAGATSSGFGPFGATQTSAAPASTGLNFGIGGAGAFGAPKPATNSLFGPSATSTAAAPAFGSFGAAPTAGAGGLFGATSTGSSLFPATSTASTGLFGNTGMTAAPAFGTSTTSTGLFGVNKPATTGGLFSQTPASGFGTTPAFGAAGAQAPSLFGGASAGGNAFGMSNLGGGFLGGSTNNAAAQAAMVASVSGNIYGDNPLFQRDPMAPASKSQPAILSRPEPTQKVPALIPPVRFSPRHSQIRLRPASSATFSSSVAGGELAPGRKSLLLLDGINDDSAFSSDDYSPRRSVKKLELKARGQEAGLNYQHQGSRTTGIVFNSTLESAASDILSRSRPSQERSGPTNGKAVETHSLFQGQQNQAGSTRHETPSPGPATMAHKPDGEYWMSPTLEELRKMSRSELQHVENFKVGLPEYGSVDFLEPVDLTTVPSLSAICGHIVIFRHKVCIVYPDEQNKPPRGQGLNVPAIISLEQCWPKAKGRLGLEKFERNSPQYADYVKRLKRMTDTTFLDFTTDNGTWTFRVEHFSEYGLTDDDDVDGDEHMAQGASGHAVVPSGIAAFARSGQDDHDQSSLIRGLVAETMQPSRTQYGSTLNASRLSTNRDPQRTNVMRAALFSDPQLNQDRHPKRSSIWSTSSVNSESENAPENANGLGAETRPSFLHEIDNKESQLHRPPRKFTRSVYEQSLLSRKGTLLADAGLMMGRSCRVGWGPDGLLAVCGTICGFESVRENSQALSSISASSVQLAKIKAVAAADDVEVQRHVVSMQAQLQNTTITLDQNNEPRARIVEGTSFNTLMNSLKELEHDLSIEEVYTWILGQSLFDAQPMPADILEMSRSSQETYECIGRRVRCSNWLSYVTKPQLEADLRGIGSSGRPSAQEEAIFALLVSNKRQQGSVAAAESGNLRLATLISQSGRGSKPLSGVEDQLAIYKDSGTDASVPISYLKIYALLSGALTINIAPAGKPQRYVTDGLDWRRTFGLHLWHSSRPGTNLKEAMEQYVDSMRSNKVVARPFPWYQQVSGKQDPEHYDFLFQLMTLAIEPSKGLEDVLHPLGMTPASLDNRVGWMFYMVLAQSLRISDFRSNASFAKISQDFMFQLETLGLWEWAVFVALHLESASTRETAVRQILERHVDLPSPPSSTSGQSTATELERWTGESQKGSFLLKVLRIPEPWLWRARATRAKYNGDLSLQVFSLLKGGEHQQGHALILTRLAPACILHGDLTTLGNLLSMVDQSKVTDWVKGGRIYQKYLDCCSDFEGSVGRVRVKGKVSYSNDLVPQGDVEDLQNEAQVLLSELPMLQTYKEASSPLLDVCVTEMASKCTSLLRDLKELSVQESGRLADLPLTEDQRMDTIQKVSNNYFDEVLTLAETSAY